MHSLTLVKRRTACCLVPALATVVAVGQFYLSHAYALTPWKGGGFGMFSSIDEPRYRFVKAYVTTPAGPMPAELSAERLEPLTTGVRFMPSPRRLTTLADAMLQARWVVDTAARPRVRLAAAHTRAKPAYEPAADAGARPVPVSAVRVEVWRVRFDAAGRRLTSEKLAELTRGPS